MGGVKVQRHWLLAGCLIPPPDILRRGSRSYSPASGQACDEGGRRGRVSPASQGEGVLAMQQCEGPGIDARLRIKIRCHHPPSCLYLL